MKKILPYLVILAVGIVIGLLCRPSHAPKVEVVQTDTLIFRDTIREAYPVEINKEVVRTEYVIVRDTLRIKDTLYLSLPFERRVYGNDDFYAEVTGYKPSLDYIEVFPKTKVVTQTITQTVTKRNALSIGIEPSYLNSLSIPIYLEYGRMLHKNVEIYGQFMYDVQSRQFGMGIGLEASIGW